MEARVIIGGDPPILVLAGGILRSLEVVSAISRQFVADSMAAAEPAEGFRFQERSTGARINKIDQLPDTAETRAILGSEGESVFPSDHFRERDQLYGGHAGIGKAEVQIHRLPVYTEILIDECSDSIFARSHKSLPFQSGQLQKARAIYR